MPPPVTPSPHRFIASSDSKQTTQQAKHRPPAVRTPSLLQAHTPVKQDAVTPSQQFKPTPRFSVNRSLSATPSYLSSTLSTVSADGAFSQSHVGTDAEPLRPSRGPRPRLSKVESIHDASQDDEDKNQEDEDEEMLYKELEDQDALLVKSVEIVEQKPASTSPHAQPAKYRHLTPNPDLTPKKDTSAIQTDPAKRKHHMTEPESPPRSSKVSRFRVPGQTPAPTPAAAMESVSTQVANYRSRNPFLLRPPHSGAAGSDPEGFTPLPEHFSPHRRSQKFVPGGMADTVRTWILNIGEGGSYSQMASILSSQRMERWQPSAQPSRLHVTECVESRPGDRLRLISGNTIPSPAIKPREGISNTRAILVGPAKGSLSSVKAGDELTIALPSWDVEIGEHSDKWLVAVNWSSN